MQDSQVGRTTADPAGPRPRTWSLAVSGIAVVSFVALLAFAWMAASTLFLIFAGILFAVFLDGIAQLLGRILPLGRGWRLTLVSVALAAFCCGLVAFSGATLVQQGRDLGQTIQTQSGAVRDWLKGYGIEVPAMPSPEPKGDPGQDGKPASLPNAKPDGAGKEGFSGIASSAMKSPGSLLSDAGSVLGPAATVVVGLFGALGNVLVIAFLGLACAADPASYRDGVLRFLPPRHRQRGAKVLDGMGETLRHWLFGQLITMAVIFVCTWAGLTLLGVGGALILGLVAGLLAFIPTIGPLISGLLIVLGSLASGPAAALGALGVYVVVQSLESYILTPFIQKRALDIPPATIFAGQLLLGVLFGLWGIALALPLMAVIKVSLEQLYIEDTLHEDPSV